MDATWKLKPSVQYQVDLSSKWITGSGFLMGLFFFLRIVYYLAVEDAASLRGGTLWVHLILPCVCAAAYFVFLRLVRLDVPLLYGILFAMLCIFRIIWGFDSAAVFWVFWYLLAVAVILGTVSGVIPIQPPLCAVLAVPTVIHCIGAITQVIRRAPGFTVAGFLPEASYACMAASMFCFSVCLRRRK